MSKENLFIGSIDQGTISTRFILYDKNAHPIGSHQVEFTQFYPQAGWVEHDPMKIIESVKICMSKAIDKAIIDGGLKAIRLTNQRETMVVWSKSTGLHLYRKWVVQTPDIPTQPVVKVAWVCCVIHDILLSTIRLVFKVAWGRF
ncbi:unnamed protein product [Camellia sinensis]